MSAFLVCQGSQRSDLGFVVLLASLFVLWYGTIYSLFYSWRRSVESKKNFRDWHNLVLLCLFVLIYSLLFSLLGFSPLICKRDQTSDRARARCSEGFSSGSKRDSVMIGTIPCIKPSNKDSDKTVPCKKKVNHFFYFASLLDSLGKLQP